MHEAGVTNSLVDLQDELLEKPCFVRLKFLGVGMPGGKLAPKHGTLKDVRARTIEDLTERVDEWLGAPGSWQLSSSANWPLTSDSMRRPTTQRCPLIVNVQNTKEALFKQWKDDMAKRLVDLDKKLDVEVRERTQMGHELQDRKASFYEVPHSSALQGQKQTRRRCSGCCIDLLRSGFCSIPVFFILIIIGWLRLDDYIKGLTSSRFSSLHDFTQKLQSQFRELDDNTVPGLVARVKLLEIDNKRLASHMRHIKKTATNASATADFAKQTLESVQKEALEHAQTLESVQKEALEHAKAIHSIHDKAEQVSQVAKDAQNRSLANNHAIRMQALEIRSVNQTAVQANVFAIAVNRSRSALEDQIKHQNHHEFEEAMKTLKIERKVREQEKLIEKVMNKTITEMKKNIASEIENRSSATLALRRAVDTAKESAALQATQLRSINRTAVNAKGLASKTALKIKRVIKGQAADLERINQTAVRAYKNARHASEKEAALREVVHDQTQEIKHVNQSVMSYAAEIVNIQKLAHRVAAELADVQRASRHTTSQQGVQLRRINETAANAIANATAASMLAKKTARVVQRAIHKKAIEMLRINQTAALAEVTASALREAIHDQVAAIQRLKITAAAGNVTSAEAVTNMSKILSDEDSFAHDLVLEIGRIQSNSSTGMASNTLLI